MTQPTDRNEHRRAAPGETEQTDHTPPLPVPGQSAPSSGRWERGGLAARRLLLA